MTLHVVPGANARCGTERIETGAVLLVHLQDGHNIDSLLAWLILNRFREVERIVLHKVVSPDYELPESGVAGMRLLSKLYGAISTSSEQLEEYRQAISKVFPSIYTLICIETGDAGEALGRLAKSGAFDRVLLLGEEKKSIWKVFGASLAQVLKDVGECPVEVIPAPAS